ncbi:hypothetical protein [Draconibacterium sp.]|uniref:Acg family FMN-binding oxidoreductase n=1 Tax=Draconibacterium sp. TaxID=1965318 RepID=UPI003563CE49
MDREELRFLIDCAIKAPSGHNSQPWKFELQENTIIIHPDFSRALPVVDGDNHALYISLGCALENILIAANNRGYKNNISILPNNDGYTCIKIDLEKSENMVPDELFGYIPLRQVCRNKYSNKKVDNNSLQELSSCFNQQGISLQVLDGKKNFSKLVHYIIEGNNLQFRNKKFVKELSDWFRYSKLEAEKKLDGLWFPSLGLPNMGRVVGNFVMKNLVSAKSEAKRIQNLLLHTQGLAVFVADTNDSESWINMGRAFQRFGLTLTKLGISHSHLNMPCEEPAVRKRLACEIKVEGKHPLILLRYGYSAKMPYSKRRNVKSVIT